MNFLSQIFSSLGGSIQGQVQQASDAATQAFYVIAGELLVIAAILIALLLVTVFGRRVV